MVAVTQRVEERLLADAVARQQQRLAPRVPQGEGEHAVQAPDAVGPVLLIEMDDDLGIALGRERMPARAKLRAQFPIVVDLAVEDDGHGPILVVHGLIARGQVDHAEPLDAQADMAVHKQPARSGPRCSRAAHIWFSSSRWTGCAPRWLTFPMIPHMVRQLNGRAGPILTQTLPRADFVSGRVVRHASVGSLRAFNVACCWS